MKSLFTRIQTVAKAFVVLAIAVLPIAVTFLVQPIPRAEAQSLASQWYVGLPGITNAIGTNDNVTVNLGSSIQLFNGPQALEFSYQGAAAAGTNSIILTFLRSFDNSTWDTVGFTWTLTGNGTTAVVARTNWVEGGLCAPYIKLSRLNNAANASAFTNLSLRICSAPR